MSEKNLRLLTKKSVQVETDHEATGAKVRAARVELGLSGRELARLIGCSAMYLCQLELGQRHWTDEKLTSVKMALGKARR